MKIVCSYIAKGIRKMYAYENIMAYSLFLTAVDVSFSETAVRVMEGDGRITLRLSVTGQLDRSVSVGLQVRSQDGTAIGESEVEKLCQHDSNQPQSLAFSAVRSYWSFKTVCFSPQLQVTIPHSSETSL